MQYRRLGGYFVGVGFARNDFVVVNEWFSK